MTEIKTVIAGAEGRMGKTLIRLIAEESQWTLLGALERRGATTLGRDSGELAGAGKNGVAVSDDPLSLIAKAEALIDFTTPASSVALAELAAQARIVHVIGTTGLSDEDERKIRAAARHAVIVKSANMSLGAALLADLVERAAKVLPDYDIEILEMHHRLKKDAPSGTALMLGDAAVKGRGGSLTEKRLKPRDGLAGARADGGIGFASLRGGTVVGEHEVVLAGPYERLVLRHVAEDRAIFARGALAAARWGQGKKPGLYTISDVLGL
jgi:4-hydroxy-tetrahydrodipicolinate reductase